jgi:hypothetical protein
MVFIVLLDLRAFLSFALLSFFAASALSNLQRCLNWLKVRVTVSMKELELVLVDCLLTPEDRE